jgi:hypothetical protein
MWALIGLSIAFLIGLSIISAYIRREEIMANWSKYRDDPAYLFSAFMFKPDTDPRSRLEFAIDNFNQTIRGAIGRVVMIFLAPVLKIFEVLMGSITQSADGVLKMRGVFSNMFKKFESVTEIFQRRYANTAHALRRTWVKLQESLKKTFSVATASLYAGLSVFKTIENSFRLMTIIAIVILGILLGFVVWFFFILWPILPLIIMAIVWISKTPYAADVMGMQDSFCFGPDTQVITPTGPKSIATIRIGDNIGTAELPTHVTGVMEFDVEDRPLMNLYGVLVSGTHIVWNEEAPCHVYDHPDARHDGAYSGKLYCLITENHAIPVESTGGPLCFADWEEISTPTELLRWHREVFETLNPGADYIEPTPEQLQSEAVVSGRTTLATPLGPVEIRNIRPGDRVFDADGNPTVVEGIVRVGVSEVARAAQIDKNAYVSMGAWVQQGGAWVTPQKDLVVPPDGETWYSLFTAAGSFRIACGEWSAVGIRDFSDVGSDTIQKTYDWVLESLMSN